MGAAYNTFSFSFDFMSASSSVQSGLKMNVEPFDYDTASRQGLFRIYDNAQDGFSVGWYDFTDNFRYTTLGGNLDRQTWYHVEGTLIFNEGGSNDSMTLLFGEKGSALTQFDLTSWEYYYELVGSPQPALAPVDTLIIRAADYTDPQGTLAGGGVYFDNITMSVSNTAVPVPAAVWLLGSGLMGLIGVRRKMRK